MDYDEGEHTCAICGKGLGMDDYIFEDPDGEEICLSCFEGHGYYVCDRCQKTFEKDDAIVDTTGGGCLCKTCAKKES